MKGQGVKKWGWLGCIVVTLVFLCAVAARADVRFMHDSKQVQLSSAGAALNFTVSLRGTKQADLPLEIEVIRDGKLSHVLIPEGRYGNDDWPLYDVRISSPSAGIGYRFRIRDKEDKVWTSDYYFILHDCEYPPSSIALQKKLPNDPLLRSTVLAQQAKSLEHQLSSYTHAVTRLSELSEFFAEEPK